MYSNLIGIYRSEGLVELSLLCSSQSLYLAKVFKELGSPDIIQVDPRLETILSQFRVDALV